MSISKLPFILLLVLSMPLQAAYGGKQGHPKGELETLPVLLEDTFTGTIIHMDEIESKLLPAVKIRAGKAVFKIQFYTHVPFQGLSFGLNDLLTFNVGDKVTVAFNCDFAINSITGKDFIVKKKNGVQVRTIHINPYDFNTCIFQSTIPATP